MVYKPTIINGYDVNPVNTNRCKFPHKIYNFITGKSEYYELKGGDVIPIKTKPPLYASSSDTAWRQLIINSFNQNNEFVIATASDVDRIASNYLAQKVNYNNYNFMNFKKEKLYGIHGDSYLYCHSPQGLYKKQRADRYINNLVSSNSLVIFIVKSIKPTVLLTGEKVEIIDTYCPNELDYFDYFYE